VASLTNPFVDAFVEAFLRALLLAWPVWLFLALLVAGRLVVGLYRRLLIARSGLQDIDAMSGEAFERYLTVLFSKLGYHVDRTASHGDFGADLVASKKRQRVVVQAKRHRRKVGVKAVQEAVAAKGYYSCDEAMVVTNNLFTRQAVKLADRNGVRLWDRYRLAKAMASVGGQRVTTQAMAPGEARPSQAAMTLEGATSLEGAHERTCAVCGKPVSDKVRDYCLANERRFGGRILCYGCQRVR
jgi:restriction system protein